MFYSVDVENGINNSFPISGELKIFPKDKMYYKDGSVYYQDVFFDVFRLDPETGNEEKIIDFINVPENKQFSEVATVYGDGIGYSNVYLQVNYCDDYISMENWYMEEENEKVYCELMIFDYNGNFIRKKNLW
jgi:hypothetical protein